MLYELTILWDKYGDAYTTHQTKTMRLIFEGKITEVEKVDSQIQGDLSVSFQRRLF
jgi:hypothetical protein